MSDAFVEGLAKSMQLHVRYTHLRQDLAFGCGATNSAHATKEQWIARKKAEIALAHERARGVQL